MAHEMFVMKNGAKRNITQLIGNLSWSSNMDALGMEMSFDYASSGNTEVLELGDHLILGNNGKVINYFVIVNESVSGRFSKSYTCFDYGWYLNKNETVIQFKKVSASKAIEKLLDKFKVKHKIVNIPTAITKIYKDMTVSDIMNDILDQASQELKTKFRLEMNKDMVTVSKLMDLVINPQIRLSSNSPLFPVTSAISNPSKSRSIEEMKNKVFVVSNDEKSTKIIAESSDQAGITKYGLMTEVVSVEAKNASQARNIAKNTLSDLNRIKGEVSVELLGHDDIRAGRILMLNEPVTNIKGLHLIKSANHSVNLGIHRVTVQLEAI